MKNVIKNKLGIEFQNEQLLQQAFTHTSYANEQKLGHLGHNERLEFLGDAIIELVVSDYLYHNFLQWSEGQLTRFRAQLVCEATLSTLAKECGFDQLVRLSRGEESGNGRMRSALLCDVFEAFVGALFLDSGLDNARAFVLEKIVPKINEVSLFKDYKTLLQEHLQKNGTVSIVYDIIRESGPAHDKEFEVQVSVNGKILGTGIGKNKKAAQQLAAKVALEKEGVK